MSNIKNQETTNETGQISSTHTEDDTRKIPVRIGNTIYFIGFFNSENVPETLDEKLKSIIESFLKKTHTDHKYWKLLAFYTA